MHGRLRSTGRDWRAQDFSLLQASRFHRRSICSCTIPNLQLFREYLLCHCGLNLQQLLPKRASRGCGVIILPVESFTRGARHWPNNGFSTDEFPFKVERGNSLSPLFIVIRSNGKARGNHSSLSALLLMFHLVVCVIMQRREIGSVVVLSACQECQLERGFWHLGKHYSLCVESKNTSDALKVARGPAVAHTTWLVISAATQRESEQPFSCVSQPFSCVSLLRICIIPKFFLPLNSTTS